MIVAHTVHIINDIENLVMFICDICLSSLKYSTQLKYKIYFFADESLGLCVNSESNSFIGFILSVLFFIQLIIHKEKISL